MENISFERREQKNKKKLIKYLCFYKMQRMHSTSRKVFDVQRNRKNGILFIVYAWKHLKYKEANVVYGGSSQPPSLPSTKRRQTRK